MPTTLERVTLGRLTLAAVTRGTIGHIGLDSLVPPIPTPTPPPIVLPSISGGDGISVKTKKIVYNEPKEQSDFSYANTLKEDQEILDIILLLSMSETL